MCAARALHVGRCRPASGAAAQGCPGDTGGGAVGGGGAGDGGGHVPADGDVSGGVRGGGGPIVSADGYGARCVAGKVMGKVSLSRGRATEATQAVAVVEVWEGAGLCGDLRRQLGAMEADVWGWIREHGAAFGRARRRGGRKFRR